MVPQAPFGDLAAANAAAAAWCAGVNGVVHSEICAVPAGLVIERELLAPLPSLRDSIGRQVVRKVDRLACVRFASARYSVPVRLIGETVGLHTDDGRLLVIMTGAGEVVAEHVLVPPGGASVRDEHYGGPRPAAPRRAVRPRTAAEKEFCALGPVAGAFITGAAAAGHTRLGPEPPELNTLRATFDSDFTRRCGLSDPPLPSVAADFDNDGKDDFAVWRSSTATWFVIDSSSGNTRTQPMGKVGDIPVPGDYRGDGTTDFALWQPDSGNWLIIDSMTGEMSNAPGGETGDIPVPGRYRGGTQTVRAIWRPANGTWFLFLFGSRKIVQSQQWGQVGDIPVPGDYDGDGRTDFAVWRPSEGRWYLKDSATGNEHSMQLGDPGDIPVPGDYDGDGRTDLAVSQPSTGTWRVRESSTGTERAVKLGDPTDIPVPGRYGTGNRTDFAVWRPGDGMWLVVDSATLQSRTQQWGQAGDVPV